MIQNKSLKLIVLAITTLTEPMALAAESVDSFTPRTQEQCANSNPAMTGWYFGSDVGAPAPIEEEVGPIRNQTPTPWCFAFATADILSQYLKIRVSASEMAKVFYGSTFEGGLVKGILGGSAGGDILPILQTLQRKSVCRESDFPAALSLRDLKNARCSADSVPVGSLSIKYLGANLGAAFKIFPGLDQALDAGKLVGVQYKAEKVFHLKYRSFLSRLQSNFASDHASTIVARQWNPERKTCDYVIRNSWGNQCYTADCKAGYYSVSEATMNKSLQTATYISDSPTAP
jgi:hypothetical protein